MRVISGSARGRQLATFAGREIRPTPDRVREALFSMLYSRRGALTESKVLDLFAGSGALGIEALSRGAQHAWFVDSSRQAVQTIGTNLERCRLSPRATIVLHDIWQALPGIAEAGPFAVIFADPPYGHDHGPRLLQEADRLGTARPAGPAVSRNSSIRPDSGPVRGAAPARPETLRLDSHSRFPSPQRGSGMNQKTDCRLPGLFRPGHLRSP